MKVRISLNGCDDTTYMERDVSEVEWDFLQRLADQSHEEGGGCAPTMHVDRQSQDRAKVRRLGSGWSWVVECEHGEGVSTDVPYEVKWGHTTQKAAEDAARAHGYEVKP